ncbi:MAG: sugar phosphate isomerase/epimerase [Planctomycetes bacterium]|nr:sugar phosphate isomerase/epimerase [Planctomycetota bacterium]
MNNPRIGIDLDDLRMPAKDALRTASRLELRAIELPAARGETSAKNLDASGRRHLLHLVNSLGLSLNSLSADAPGLRLTDSKTVDERVDRSIEVIQLARELHVPLVTAAVGQLTHPETGEPSSMAMQALARIGEFADSRGVCFAIRPSYDGGTRLAATLDALRCPSLRVGLDPAAMVICGVNPLADIEKFVQHISHFHARDATAGLPDRPGTETRLGEGEVDLTGCLMVLHAAEYRGAYILRRTASARPIEDLLAARDALKRRIEDVSGP